MVYSVIIMAANKLYSLYKTATWKKVISFILIERLYRSSIEALQ